MTRPNLVIAGAPKCGTTSLHDWLSMHPQAFGAKEKELRFLMDENYPLTRDGGYIKSGLYGYSRYFEGARTGEYECVFETTPDYIYQKKAIEVLSSELLETRVAFILRRPADRVLSMYKFAQNNISIIPAEMTFQEFVDEIQIQGADGELGGALKDRLIIAHTIQHSKYFDYLKSWYDHIEPQRISIWRFEELAADPKCFMRKFASHYGLHENFYNDFAFIRSNESFTVKNQKLNRIFRSIRPFIPAAVQTPRTRKWTRDAYRKLVKESPSVALPQEDYSAILNNLDKLFEPENERLEKLTGIDFSSWNEDR